MKKIYIITSLLIILSCNLFSQEQKNFVLNGITDEKYNNDTIFLFVSNKNELLRTDTAIIRNGKFHFSSSVYINYFSLLNIAHRPDSITWVQVLQEVILDEGNIEVSIGEKSRVGGSRLNIEYQTYIDSCQIYQDEIKIKGGDPEVGDEERFTLFAKYRYYKYLYKKRNSHNILGYRAYVQDFFDFTDNNFDDLYNNVFAHKKDDAEIIKLMSDRQAYSDRQKMVGEDFIDFELLSLSGEKKMISDYVGKSKYLFIDFWASWCGPCIADIPHIKEVYNKYKDKGLTVLGISFDEEQSAWEKALKRIDAPWDHLCETKGIQSELGKAYNIRGIPYAILLDQDGKILLVNQRGQFLEYYLEYLFDE